MRNLRIIELHFSDCELKDSRVIFLIDILFNLADNLVEYSIDLQNNNLTDLTALKLE